MYFVEIIKDSWKSLLSNKVRTFLSMLGIIIGVAAFVTVVSIGQGTSESIKKNLTSIGTNLIYITPGYKGGRSGKAAISLSELLTEDDVEVIRNSVNNIVYALPFNSLNGIARYKSFNTFRSILGAPPEIFEMLSLGLADGEFFSQEDERSKRSVCIVGYDIAQDLFSDGDVVGKKIYVTVGKVRKSLKIIGVLKESGNILFLNPDRSIIIPFSTSKYLANRQYISSILVQASSEKTVKEVTNQIDEIMFNKFGDENMYRIISQDTILQNVNQAMSLVSLMLGAIAGISLLVGGIGIMNVMLISVVERIREIGIRKAIGATKTDILFLFLIEAVMITLLAGIIGIGLSYILSYVLTSFTQLNSLITITNILIAIGFSSMIGIIFGLLPAIRAANLDPIEAIRYE